MFDENGSSRSINLKEKSLEPKFNFEGCNEIRRTLKNKTIKKNNYKRKGLGKDVFRTCPGHLVTECCELARLRFKIVRAIFPESDASHIG